MQGGRKLGIKAAVKCQGVYLTAAYIETDLSDFAADRRRLDQEMNEKKKHDPSAGILSVSGCGTGGWKPPADHAQIHYETESENVTRIQLQKGTLIKILSIINVCFRYWTMESAMDIRKRWTSFQRVMGKTAWLRSSPLTATDGRPDE